MANSKNQGPNSSIPIYLVGLRKESPGYGGINNTVEMPEYCFTSFRKAERKYRELVALGSRPPDFEYQEPYLLKAVPGDDGGTIEAIHGTLVPYLLRNVLK